MPEAYRYAFAVTLSMPTDLSDDMCKEFVRLCKKAEYYAVVFELDENGRKHAHAGVMYKLARKAYNVTHGTFLAGKTMKDLIEDGGGDLSRAVKTTTMASDAWIANYMQKDGLIDVHNLPDDFEELRYYFPDTAVVKTANPIMEKWERMYRNEAWPQWVTAESAEEFFETHMNEKRDMKVEPDTRKLKQRYAAFAKFVNKQVTGKRKQTDGLEGPQHVHCGATCFCGCPGGIVHNCPARNA